MLPGTDGLEVCRTLKSHPATATLPIIMLSAKTEEFDKVLGLELDADDYLKKPFSPRELKARINAIFRRVQKDKHLTGEVIIGRLKLNFVRHEAFLNNLKLELTPKEF